MIYFAPGGIHGMDMAIRKTCLTVPNPSRRRPQPRLEESASFANES